MWICNVRVIVFGIVRRRPFFDAKRTVLLLPVWKFLGTRFQTEYSLTSNYFREWEFILNLDTRSQILSEEFIETPKFCALNLNLSLPYVYFPQTCSLFNWKAAFLYWNLQPIKTFLYGNLTRRYPIQTHIYTSLFWALLVKYKDRYESQSFWGESFEGPTTFKIKSSNVISKMTWNLQYEQYYGKKFGLEGCLSLPEKLNQCYDKKCNHVYVLFLLCSFVSFFVRIAL